MLKFQGHTIFSLFLFGGRLKKDIPLFPTLEVYLIHEENGT
jgi:hypothetical protein